MRIIVLIAHDIRSVHNVGSLLRTAEGLGVDEVYLTGYSPYPRQDNDTRLPHLAKKLNSQISKTALGAEKNLGKHNENINSLITDLKEQGFKIIGLEQSPKSTPLTEYSPPDKVAVLLGREVDGIEHELLDLCDEIVEIPMFGKKESFNVVQAAAMALFEMRFYK